MKKKLVMVLMAVMVATAALGGCGQKGATTDSSVSAEEEKDVEIPAKELLKATDYKVEKYVKLNDYMNMTVELSKDYTVSDADIQSYIEYLMSMYPSYEVSDKKTVESGDVVNIDYVGKIDGEEFSGGSATGQHLKIGSGSFIDGFEDGLIGANTGEERSLNLTFPEDYANADLAGQAVVFDVTVNKIEEKKNAVLDDAFVQRVSDFSTVDEFKADTMETLQKEKEQSAAQQVEDDAFAAAMDNSEYSLNEAAVEQQYNNQVSYYENMFSSYGFTMESYAEMMGQTEDEFKATLHTAAENAIKQQLLIAAVAEKEGFTVDDADRESLAERYGTDVKTLQDTYGADMVDETAMIYKVVEFIGKNAVVK